ncbi:hypothetical protein HZS55_01270 [Halosimplex rubrum]|uniref:Uncharacterized protein n=1 Tax=Halosimplex rubrum TaxID=869889 RepID=A0A7D5P2Z0_9EURY|nr:hypothetical protein [Halosimplex rubrum]QLH76018.1 hypothetical protein HZS55_01270 [Halosimplex rubrum]
MDATYESNRSSVTIDSREWAVPGKIRDAEESAHHLVVSIIPPEQIVGDHAQLAENADIDLPATNQNLIGFDERGRHDWVVGEPKHSGPNDGFMDLQTVSGRFIATNSDDHHYEIEPSTGEIVDRWTETELPIGDRVVSFVSPIQDVFQLGDLVVVQEGVSGASVHGFETDGSRRWRKNGRSGFEIRDDLLVETVVPNDSRRAILRIDPETGKRVEVLESDLPDPEQYVAASER